MGEQQQVRGLSLMSGGLDSQLAICVLQRAGAYMEAVCFETPFFTADKARAAAAALGVKLHVVDFTDDEIELIKNPPHGFGGAMNPCIDCHATMIRRAGELMRELGFDFVSTGEVLNQRPMSQNRQSLGIVARDSGLEGRLVRPLSAQLLDPSVPEQEGRLDRTKLLALQGRRREPQVQLAAEFGLTDYPSPAGGCKLTEEGFSNRLRDLMEHESLDERRLVRLLSRGRRFRLPEGASVILGRNGEENAVLAKRRIATDVMLEPVGASGPTALIPAPKVPLAQADLARAQVIVAAWSRDDGSGRELSVRMTRGETVTTVPVPQPYDRTAFMAYQLR